MGVGVFSVISPLPITNGPLLAVCCLRRLPSHVEGIDVRPVRRPNSASAMDGAHMHMEPKVRATLRATGQRAVLH